MRFLLWLEGIPCIDQCVFLSDSERSLLARWRMLVTPFGCFFSNSEELLCRFSGNRWESRTYFLGCPMQILLLLGGTSLGSWLYWGIVMADRLG